jgi:hypothetical protein
MRYIPVVREHDMRVILARVCRDLDAARAALVLPAVVGGAAVASVGCVLSESYAVYMAPCDGRCPAFDAGDADAEGDAVQEDAPVDDGPVVKYGAPDAGLDADTVPRPDDGDSSDG